MNYSALQRTASDRHLSLLGGFHPDPTQGVPEDCKTLVLLGPGRLGFWQHFTQTREYRDGAPDAMDRWSRRVLGDWAAEIGAETAFPFGSTPPRPFIDWALATGRCHISPVTLLVHDDVGLFVSFRGALLLRERVDLPPSPPSPCVRCTDKPCRAACPVSALAGGDYDVAACKGFIRAEPTGDCLEHGCKVRRTCPVSQAYGRLAEHAHFHMKAFL